MHTLSHHEKDLLIDLLLHTLTNIQSQLNDTHFVIHPSLLPARIAEIQREITATLRTFENLTDPPDQPTLW